MTLPGGHQVHRQGERQDLRLQGPVLTSRRRRRSSTRTTGKFLRQRAGPRRASTSRPSGAARSTRPAREDNYRVAGPDGRRRPQHVRHRAEARPRQEGLPGHQGRLRVRPGRREVHHGRPDERGPLVPDAHHAHGRQGPVVSGLDEIGQIVPGKNEIYDPETKKWKYTEGRPAVPDLPGDLPDGERQALLLGLERRLRAGRHRPRPRRLGPEDQQVHQDPRPERPELLETVRDRAAAAGAGPEVHGDRRWRGRRVGEVQQEDPARRPAWPTSRASRTAPTLDEGHALSAAPRSCPTTRS